MAAKRAQSEQLFATTWVHVFEEDTAEGAVYRPEDDDIPLSRRPRERLQFDRDGSARLLTAGADDRFVEQPATWTTEDDSMVLRQAAGVCPLRIVQLSPSQLLVQQQSQRTP
ncbi:hypothetical protein BH20VER1_BH20VER1_05750 [soil metagenome]